MTTPDQIDRAALEAIRETLSPCCDPSSADGKAIRKAFTQVDALLRGKIWRCHGCGEFLYEEPAAYNGDAHVIVCRDASGEPYPDVCGPCVPCLRVAPAGEQKPLDPLAYFCVLCGVQMNRDGSYNCAHGAPPAEEPVADGLSASERWFVIEGFIAGYSKAGGIPLRNQRVSDMARDWLQDSVAGAVTVEMALASQAALNARPPAPRGATDQLEQEKE